MELFDQVRAAPPPDRIREIKPPTEVENGGRDGDDDEDDDDMKDICMPSPMAATPSPDFTLDKHKNKHKEMEKAKENAPELKKCEEEEEGSLKALKRKISQDSIMVDKDKTDITAELETELEEEDQPQQHSPPKTKAEQKMFIDLQPETRKSSTIVSLKSNPITTTSIKKCRVRIKRLSKREITLHTRSSSGSNGNQRKRGRSRRNEDEEDDIDSDLPSPSKKSKINPRIHVKIPWLQNGSKRSALKKSTRAHTPPPSKLKKLARGKGVGKNRPPVSPALIRRYGKRFFSCVVKLKRCPMSWPLHVATLLNNSTSNSAKRRSRKSNLSVSFSEAVEIFGSNESGTRRSTLGSGRTPRRVSVSVPTRLQRVDATGNILEDISLMSNAPLRGPSSSKRARRASSGNKTSETCNGGDLSSSKFKRSSLRVPVTGLASLHLGNKRRSKMDTADDSDDDDEYIVPNDLPGIHRAGTPVARIMRKRVTITTTTISDDDDDEEKDKEGGGEKGEVNSVLLAQKTEYKDLKENNNEETKQEETVEVEQTKEQKAKEEEKKVNKEKLQEEEQKTKEKEIKEKKAVEKEKSKDDEKAEEEEKTKQAEAKDNTMEKSEMTKKITVEEDKSEEDEKVKEDEKAKEVDKAKEDEKEEEMEVSENTNEKKEKEQREDRKEKEEANEKEEKYETEGKQIEEEKEYKIEKETEEKDAFEEQQETEIEEKSTIQEERDENVEEKLEERKEDKANEGEKEEELQQELLQLSETDNEEVKKNKSETAKYYTDKIESKDVNEKTMDDMETEEASNDGVSNMEPLLVRQTDISIKEDDETDGHKNEPSAKDNEMKKTNMESSKAKSSPLFFLNSTKQEDPDDILEIETSFDDVRDLHTPLSNNSRCSTPQTKDLTKKILQPLRSRLDSGDSDSSFKSATEMHIPVSTITETLSSISNPSTATNTTGTSQLNKSPVATLTEISEPQGSSTVSIPTPPFSGIGVIPNLDDLEQLTEPNFQLSSSRHLDDIIMTELES